MIDDEITKLELEFHEKRLKQFNEHMPELISYLGLDEDKLLYGVGATVVKNDTPSWEYNTSLIESLVLIQPDEDIAPQNYSIISSTSPNKKGISIVDIISVPNDMNISDILAKYIQYFDESCIEANKITLEDRYLHTFKNSIQITNAGKIFITNDALYIFDDKENKTEPYSNIPSITLNALLRVRFNKGELFNNVIIPSTTNSDQETYNFLLKQP